MDEADFLKQEQANADRDWYWVVVKLIVVAVVAAVIVAAIFVTFELEDKDPIPAAVHGAETVLEGAPAVK